MIKRPTILFLGAGASMPYGFPSGRKLIEEIVYEFPGGIDLNHLSELGCSKEAVAELKSALWESAAPSVDEFLYRRRDLVDVGVVATAWAIVRREVRSKLRLQDHGEKDWYGYLMARLTEEVSFEGFSLNQIKVVTLNYDRSFEAYAVRALSRRYGVQEQEAGATFMSSVPVIHLHGQVGLLHGDAQRSRPYSSDLGLETLRVASTGIRMLYNSGPTREEKYAYGIANQAMKEAERVLFLGFGFHSLVLSRLELPKSGFVAGTALGTTRREREDVETRTRKLLLADSLRDKEIVPFFREFVDLN